MQHESSASSPIGVVDADVSAELPAHAGTAAMETSAPSHLASPIPEAEFLRQELSLERTRRAVFESVARQEVLTLSLQAIIQMVEREIPRSSACILLPSESQDSAVLGVSGRLGENFLSVALALAPIADARTRQLIPIRPAADTPTDVIAGLLRQSPEAAAVWIANLMPMGEAEPGAERLVLVMEDTAPLSVAAERVLGLAVELGVFVIAHHRQAAQATRQLMHDPLTNLPNVTLLADRLSYAIEVARRQQASVAVLMIDLDGLQLINQTGGREAGDDVIRQVASRLQNHLRRSDILARTGGDKFTVVGQLAAGRQDAAGLAAKILAILAAPVSMDGQDVSLGANLGVSLFPDDGDASGHLLHAAEMALHRAKQAGRNTIELFRSIPEDGKSLEDLQMDGQLRRAIAAALLRSASCEEADGPGHAIDKSLQSALQIDGSDLNNSGVLSLHYQPQVDSSGRIVAVEALARWKHPTFGQVPPNRFIAVAERGGLIVPFGDWALREAVRQAAIWRKQFGNRAPRVAVNVSALQFAHPNFIESIEQLMADTATPPGAIEVEITETMLMRDTADASVKIARLRAAGISVALDDFGTGYSSLAYLNRLTLDALKIDRSFVAGMSGGERRGPDRSVHLSEQAGTSAGGLAVIRAIVSMGRSLGMTVIAEGVETESQHRRLERLGCGLMQGYLFSRPVPESELTTMIKQGALPKVAAVA